MNEWIEYREKMRFDDIFQYLYQLTCMYVLSMYIKKAPLKLQREKRKKKKQMNIVQIAQIFTP